MTALQILAQIVAVIIIILMAIGAQSKTQKRFLFFQILENALYCLHYIFLSATTAFVICVICVIRTVIFYLYRKNNKTVPVWLLIVILGITIGSGIFTWDGWLSILPILATILFTLAQWQQNVQTTRIAIIFADMFWIIYNIYYVAYVDVAGKAIEIISCTIAIILYLQHLKKQPGPLV